ncbi:MAG TPA: hypothetical protein VJN18_22315 [Polyangiaceae bacterium]|nr:hypothetical protein [Polyangiaceae bacterium]
MPRALRAWLPGWAAIAPALLAGVAGCEQRRSEPPPVVSASEPSPNASILPAPLVAGPPKTLPRDAGHAPSIDSSTDAAAPEPPRPIRDDENLTLESELRAAPGVSIEARFRWLEPLPPRTLESNAEALNKARDKTSFELTLDISSLGRLRLSFASRAHPLPQGAELRAREDRYGHILVWPNGSTYTTLAPGTLRAALSEARLDVTPLTDPSVVSAGAGNLFGATTRKQRLETSIGRLELEQATLPASGAGGALLCRLLLELLAVSPESSACHAEALPVHAEYTWATGARFELEITKLTKRAELPLEGLAVPPSGADARRGELPGTPFVALIEERELSDFRTRALPAPEKAEPGAPKLGLIFQNRGDGPRYLLIDGVPVVWLRADAEWLVTGLKQGRYTVQARDFFGAESTPARTLDLPARFLVGEEPERAQH